MLIGHFSFLLPASSAFFIIPPVVTATKSLKRPPPGVLVRSSAKMNKPNFYLSLNNRFESLDTISENNTNDDMDQTSTTAKTSTNVDASATKVKVPPIVVGGQFYDKLINTLTQLEITLYTLKLTSVGIRINLSDMTRYKQILRAFKSPEHAMSFYTHDAGNKPQKFVLKGLPIHTNETIIKSKLAESNLAPVDIKPMTIKAPSFASQANFIIYFNNGTTNLNDLKQITSINNIAVIWQHYRSPKMCEMQW